MTTDYPKKLNYKPEGRRNIGRDGKMISGRKEQAKGLSLIVDDDDNNT